jgi:hypothetical protein
MVRDRFHLEIIAENHALEAELFPKQVVDDVLRKCGRHLFIECGHKDVGRHD